jgi:hypothetical protein
MTIENKREDKLIKQLEKSMKMNKRKKKKGESTPLPKAFKDDGLDCILVNKSRVAKVCTHPGPSTFSLVFKCSPSAILNASRHPVLA